MKRKLIALLLILALSVSALSLPALAAAPKDDVAEPQIAYRMCPKCSRSVPCREIRKLFSETTVNGCQFGVTGRHTHYIYRVYVLYGCPNCGTFEYPLRFEEECRGK